MAAVPEQPGGAAQWEPGQLLLDRYRVRECVRQSGSCQLFRGQDVFRGNHHLLLRPSPQVVEREGWREWFAEFSRNALSVPPHPNVLVCERMTEEGDLPFLILEDAQGKGWDEAIFERGLSDLSQMLDVALQTARGLVWLHEHKQVHYNVKPANVLICDSGIVKVWKYGEPDARTRAYAAPEQLAGDRPVTPAADVWSWAVSVLHMFAGRVAWRSGADAPLALRRYMQSGPAEPGIPLMPGTAARLLSRCLKSDPDERTITMKDIVAAVEALTKEPAAAGTPAGQASGEGTAEGDQAASDEATAASSRDAAAQASAETADLTEETEADLFPADEPPESQAPDAGA